MNKFNSKNFYEIKKTDIKDFENENCEENEEFENSLINLNENLNTEKERVIK